MKFRSRILRTIRHLRGLALPNARPLLRLICIQFSIAAHVSASDGHNHPPASPIANSPTATGPHAGLNFANPSRHPYADTREGRDGHRNASAAINRYRLYDFYQRQADYYIEGHKIPEVLPAYPGLDSGTYGHWGRQSRMDISKDVWSSIVNGPAVGGIIEHRQTTINKAVSVELGGSNRLACAFDPETLAYRLVWRDGFLEYPTLRWGLIGTLKIKGTTLLEGSASTPWSTNTNEAPGLLEYKGYDMFDDRVAFNYRIDDVDIVDAPHSYNFDDETIFTRTLEIAPHSQTLFLALKSESPAAIEIVQENRTFAWVSNPDSNAPIIAARSDSTDLKIDLSVSQIGSIRLRIPPSDARERIKLYYGFALHKGSGMLKAIASDELESLIRFSRGGAKRWNIPMQLSGRNSQTNGAYAIDDIPAPLGNPYFAPMFLTGLAFSDNGDAFVCGFHGDVWKASGLDDQLRSIRWERIATGLHQPLGIEIFEDDIFVIGRDQLTRLEDYNDDGEIDGYKCVTNSFPTTTGSHDYYTGLQADSSGNLYFASSSVYRLSQDGSKLETIASGIRNPNGLGVTPDGRVYVAPQEGQWTPATMIIKAQKNGFYGYGHTAPDRPIDLPLCYIPRGIDNSAGGQVWTDDVRFGPLSDQLIALSFGYGSYSLILEDDRGKKSPNGAVVPLPGDFLSGVHRGRINPRDGQLYTVGSSGWASYAQYDGAFHRIRYTNQNFYDPVGFEIFRNGVRIDFSSTLDPNRIDRSSRFFAQQWNYQYSSGYGSPEYSVKRPNEFGHDPVSIRSWHIIENGKSLFLEIPDIAPVMQLHLRMHLPFAGSGDLQKTQIFCTIADTGSPMINLPDLAPWNPDESPPLKPLIRVPPKRSINAYAIDERMPGRPIDLQASAGLQYDRSTINAKAGERITLSLRNADQMPHNWVLARQGRYQAIGEAADQLIAHPDGLAQNYVPDSDDVLASIPVIQPGETASISFTVPTQPGAYVYLCTYPGHWKVMRGTLFVY